MSVSDGFFVPQKGVWLLIVVLESGEAKLTRPRYTYCKPCKARHWMG